MGRCGGKFKLKTNKTRGSKQQRRKLRKYF